ncbi:MAG: discoidin domain-containing protein [Bacteroidota bacterium]
MTNIALNKNVLEKESWTNSESLTDGNATDYNGKIGFGYTSYPNYCTLDLEETKDIEFIRILLWDKDTRNYKYRLLTSVDRNIWEVHFDTENFGTRGWQNFEFPDKIKIRYIRIHCLWNSMNQLFHIVQIEAYEDKIFVPPKEIHHVIKTQINLKEFSDGFSISSKLQPIVTAIKEIPIKFPMLRKETFTGIASELETRIYDVEKIENGMEAIRRQIIEPVNQELTASNKIGKWSIWLGLVGWACWYYFFAEFSIWMDLKVIVYNFN